MSEWASLLTTAAVIDKATPPLLALGIISAPQYLERRLGTRHSWLQWPNVKSGRVYARFVVRSGHAPHWLAQLLAAEQERYHDMLPAPAVAWNETRLRGPVLSLAAWLQHAVEHLSSASYIGKMDDDAYLHAADFERLVLTVAATPRSEHVYMGSMTWFHWQPGIFERSGHGWNYGQALKNGASCRNTTSARARCGGDARCGACVGPFQFASGYLIVLSAPVAAWLVRAQGTLPADVARLRAAGDSLVSRSGKPQDRVMEDIWLGSLLFRDPPPRPLTFVTLVGWQGLISDSWGLVTTRQAVLTHVKAKSLPRLLHLHQYTQHKHCPAPLTLQCDEGCRGFAGKYRGGVEEVERAAPAFCNGAQAGVRRCAFVEPTGPDASKCCRGKACASKVDLLEHGLPEEATRREQQLHEQSRALLALLPPKPTPAPRPSRPRGGKAKGRGAPLLGLPAKTRAMLERYRTGTARVYKRHGRAPRPRVAAHSQR